ncbi:MAG: HAD-IA family hydrolase [Gemmatimonadaceae bacterium]|jgi:2-haloalkanoic acid dehalogenase type II|nr:HAD-IA family hydrolase [Gemmatimonadaceae bacterium]
MPGIAPRAILFDLLTALLDSWTLWERAAGSEDGGRRWRAEYLRRTYGAGDYVPYDELVRASAEATGVSSAAVSELSSAWETLAPWPDVAMTLRRLPRSLSLGVVTNCSYVLGRQAAAIVERAMGRPLDVIVTAEEAGAYKPDPRPYRAALAALQYAPHDVLFVAGSPSDLGGAAGVGMPIVWHNAIGVRRPETQPVPLAEGRSLAATLHAVGVGDGITLRIATGSDARAVAELAAETFRDTYGDNHNPALVEQYIAAHFSVRETTRVLEDPTTTVVVLEAPDGTLLGYYVWRAQPLPPGSTVTARRPCELVRIYLRKTRHGGGLGSSLLRDAMDRTRAADGDLLWLSVWQHNAQAISFYQRLGFAHAGETIFDFFGEPEDDFVMARRT